MNMIALTSGKAVGLSLFVLVLIGGSTTAGAAVSSSPAPQLTQIAPGVWRIRFGQPEKFTPTYFRSAPADMAGLDAMRSNQPMPIDLSRVHFRISDRGCSLQLPMKSNESIYGFGLHTELFDMTQTKNGQTGRRVFLKPTDKPENDLGESHAPVPFYVSSAGYGVFVNTSRFASFYTGDVSPVPNTAEGGKVGPKSNTPDLNGSQKPKLKTMLVDIPTAKGVDVYVFAGPTMLDAVERYNLFSGGGAMPPLWGLGVQYRGYTSFDAAQTLDLAKRLRSAHMPCDVWGVEPGWQSNAYSCSFVWDKGRFPKPDSFLQAMHAMGYKMNFWEHAFTNPSSPIYKELKPWSGDYLVWNGLVPDFATPQARKIFLKQNDLSLFDRGVESMKLDECDYQPESPTPWSFPPAASFPSGMDGELMHSLFGVLYQQTMLEPYEHEHLRTWGLVRESQALASPLPYVLYSDSYDARCYVRGLVNEGFSGLLWDPEVRVAASVGDFYRRLEIAVFSPDAVIDSWFIPNPPWDQVDRDKNLLNEFMADRDSVAGVTRKLLDLRMSFIPYLYSAFNEYRATGKPPIRALVLDWPNDPKVRQIDDEYMFGNSVLVAPMFAGDSSRSVYLPAGEWYNFWTHMKLKGDTTVTAANAIGQIPLYVKSGTLLPLAKPVEYIQPNTCFNITVYVAGDKPADFTLYEDDGLSTAYLKGAQDRLVLHYDGGERSVSRSGDYHGPVRYRIDAWKKF